MYDLWIRNLTLSTSSMISHIEQELRKQPDNEALWGALATLRSSEYGRVALLECMGERGEVSSDHLFALAENACQKVIELRPDEAQSYSKMGMLLEQESRWTSLRMGPQGAIPSVPETALDFYKKALSIDPDDVLALRQMASHYHQIKDWAEFVLYADRLEKCSTEDDLLLLFLRTQMYRSQGLYDQAIEGYQRLIAQDENVISHTESLMHVLFEAKRFEEMLLLAEDYKARYPMKSGVYIVLIRYYEAQGMANEQKEAEAKYEELIAQSLKVSQQKLDEAKQSLLRTSDV